MGKDKIGTTFSVRVTAYDGDTETVQIHSDAWDLDMEKLFEMFKRLLGALGFSGVEEYFTEDGEYCGTDYREDFVELAPTPESCTLAKVIGELNGECMTCDTACEDTACLKLEPVADDDRLW